MDNESLNFNDAFEYAVDAFDREDYETAYKLFLPLAEQGGCSSTIQFRKDV